MAVTVVVEVAFKMGLEGREICWKSGGGRKESSYRVHSRCITLKLSSVEWGDNEKNPPTNFSCLLMPLIVLHEGRSESKRQIPYLSTKILLSIFVFPPSVGELPAPGCLQFFCLYLHFPVGNPPPHMAWNMVLLTCAVNVRHTLDFEDIVRKENTSILGIDYMLKWYFG